MYRLGVVALIGCLVLAPPASAVDLNGRWHVDAGGGSIDPFDTITQSSDAVTILGVPGTLTPGSPFSTYTAREVGGASVTEIVGRVMPSENLLDGRFIFFIHSGRTVLPLVMNRCSCFDGNIDDGDGCSAECRLEPCWTCTGHPSVCAPSPDGAACDDYDPCTSGETCSAGTCSGAAVPACINMSGTWSRERVIDGVGTQHLVTALRQFDGDVIGTGYVGTIDPSTGAFDVRRINGALACPPFNPLAGTVAADALSYTATGFVGVPRPDEPGQCDLLAVTETGTRVTTTSTSTSTSTTTSTTLPSGTVCQVAPVSGCRQPIQPRKAKLILTDRAFDGADTVTWKWTKGAATAVGAYGDPTTTTDYAACLYDGDGILRMTLRMPAGTAWRAKSTKGFAYSERGLAPDGVSKATLSSGADGRAKMTLAARGEPIPMPPLAGLSLPVRFQFQGNGQCWEAVFGDPDESSASRFKASSN